MLAYTDELVLAGGRVADGTFEALRAHLSDEEILELTYVTLTYELHATMCRALRLEYDDVGRTHRRDPRAPTTAPGLRPRATSCATSAAPTTTRDD